MSFFSSIFSRSKDTDTDTDTDVKDTNTDDSGGSGDGGGNGATTPSSDTAQTDKSQAAGGADNPGTQTYAMDEGSGEIVTSQQAEANNTVNTTPTTTQQTVMQMDEATGDVVAVTQDAAAVQQGATGAQQAQVDTTGAGEQKPALATPSYLADWQSGTTFNDAIKSGDHSIAEYIADYNKYAAANGGEPLDIFTMMNAMQGRDVNKSVAENQADEKKRVRQERWAQAANVLSHIGNFVGTLYGAPSQTIESGIALSQRQQALRDKTLAQRSAYNTNLLAQIWKDRADQRAADKNKADIGLIQQRVQSLAADEERKNAMNEANIALAGARQQQAEEAAKLSQQRAETEEQMRAPKIANMKASTNAHNASAAASRARANASNASAYGTNYKTNRYKIWAQNKRKHPNDFKEFMNTNNIHSWDRKNWSGELIDQFNAWIADKYETQGGGNGGGSGSGSGGSASSLLD